MSWKRSKPFAVLTAAVVLLALCDTLHGKVVKGSIKTDEQFVFLGKFAFESYDRAVALHEKGHGEVDMKFNWRKKGQLVALYHDDDNSWQSAESNLPCEKKRDIANLRFHMIGNDEKQEKEWDVEGGNRARYWYVAALNCNDDDDQGIDMDYELHFINPGGWWHREFSLDMQGINQMWLAFIVLYTIGFVPHVYGLMKLKKTNSLHPIVQLLTISIVLQYLALVCDEIHYWSYGNNGMGHPTFELLGVALEFAAEIVFMTLLVLLAKGWTISVNELTQGKFLFTILICYIACFFVLYIWDEFFVSEADTVYLYGTWPGFLLCALRFITMVWFFHCLVDTYKEEVHPDKRRFYRNFGLVFGLWFLSLPLLVVIAHFTPPWWRFIVVEGCEICITTVAFAVLNYLLWPTKASDYFKITPEEQSVLGTTPYDDL